MRGWVARVSPAPNMYHQTVLSNLAKEVLIQIERPRRVFLAPFGVRLQHSDGRESVVQPDLCVVCDETKLTKQGCDGAPDWIIEILSPGNTKRDTRDKYSIYEEAGVREYWIVDPTHGSIERYLLGDEHYLRQTPCFEDDPSFSSFVFPGLTLSGEAVFLR